ncbi:MAG: hypothetical protein J6P44_06420 [Bacteroidales bacterium]|nr:hypothetical protein [Bacteroidales bacterium]
MSTNDEFITWDENPKLPKRNDIIKEDKPYSLYGELQTKLDPENYMGDNYDAQKLEICNELYSQLLNINNEDKVNLRLLRNQAMDKLGLDFSFEHLYKQLSEFCNPKQFMNPYNKELIDLSNECYKYIQENKSDIRKLEAISELNAYIKLYNYKETKRIEAAKLQEEKELLRKENELLEKQELELLARQCEEERIKKLKKQQELENKNEGQRLKYLEKLQQEQEDSDKRARRILIWMAIISVLFICFIITMDMCSSTDNYEYGTVSETETISEVNDDISSFTTYSNKWYSISYPSDWRYQELDAQKYMMDVYIGKEDASVSFSVLHFPTDYNLYEVNQMGNDDLENAGATILSNNLKDINGLKCYVTKLKIQNHTQLSYTFQKNNNIYNVKFTSPTDWIDKHKNIIEKIINSFNIK